MICMVILTLPDDHQTPPVDHQKTAGIGPYRTHSKTVEQKEKSKTISQIVQTPSETLQIHGQGNHLLDCHPPILWGLAMVWCNIGAIMIGSGPLATKRHRGDNALATISYTPSDFSTKSIRPY